MRIGVPKETYPGETRVALVPDSAAALVKAGHEVVVETGAGEAAYYPDDRYTAAGARVASRDEAFGAEVVLQVRTPPANPASGAADLPRLRPGQVLVGLADPLAPGELMREVAARGVTLFALELVPRITRAQPMDVLSSMATIAGYKAVLAAASTLPRLFPMLTTAAGTIPPAHVFVVGAGVAGLQAIATARRLGARVSAYDVRPAVKEQVQSLGARFVELPLEAGDTEDRGGYAKALDEAFYRRQREMMRQVVASSDVVITTALVPGRRAPVLVTEEMVKGMAPGSVVVDLAAERGGNCELTKPDESVVRHGVTILGPTNLPATVPFHASRMYARNITAFVQHALKGGPSAIDPSDEIVRETLVARGGELVHAQVRELAAVAR